MTDVRYYYLNDIKQLAKTEDGYPYRLTLEKKWVHDVHVADRLHDYGDYSCMEIDDISDAEAVILLKKLYGLDESFM